MTEYAAVPIEERTEQENEEFRKANPNSPICEFVVGCWNWRSGLKLLRRKCL